MHCNFECVCCKKVTNSSPVGENILEHMHKRKKKKKSTYILTVIRPVELLPVSKSHAAVRIDNKRILSLQNGLQILITATSLTAYSYHYR